MDKYRVTLTPEEPNELERWVSAGKAAARKLTHARILLLADATPGQGHPAADIGAALGARLRTIERARQRFVTACCLTTRGTRWSASTRPASSCSARYDRPRRPDRVAPRGWTTRTSGRESATSS